MTHEPQKAVWAFPSYILTVLEASSLSTSIELPVIGGHESYFALLNYRKAYDECWDILVRNTELGTLRNDSLDAAAISKAIECDFGTIIGVLKRVMNDKSDYKQCFATSTEHSQILLNLLQEFLQEPSADIPQGKCWKALLNLSNVSGLHPECLRLPTVVREGTDAANGGSFADVWKGKVGETPVALKVVRLFEDRDKKAALKHFLREALIWNQFRHSNVLPFLGLYYLGERICFVSPWMEKGHLKRFLAENPFADKMMLCHDVAHGVSFLHDNKVVHGDLKSENILITPLGRACIADFGLSNIVESQAYQSATLHSSTAKGGTVRWQAPELFLQAGSPNTFASDVYAVGSIFYELFEGDLPFHELRNDAAVILNVVQGKRPARPSGVTDNIWQIMESCWLADPNSRPPMVSLVESVHSTGENNCPAPDWEYVNVGREEIGNLVRKYSLVPSIKEVRSLLKLIEENDPNGFVNEKLLNTNSSVPSGVSTRVPNSLSTSGSVNRKGGLRSVQEAADLQPNLYAPKMIGRPSLKGDGWLNPLQLLTTDIVSTYTRCNRFFFYHSNRDSGHALTTPSNPEHNQGLDNKNNDLILSVNNHLGPESHNYRVLDVIGQGVSSQVVKCQDTTNQEIVAVKVVKNTSECFNRSLLEITILEQLNLAGGSNGTYHIVGFKDSFIYRSHQCLVFELMSCDLYELMGNTQFRGLPLRLIQVFMDQLLDALTTMKERGIIHCDLKPENILLSSYNSPHIKVIDFGSACHERRPDYSSKQSRFYRSPEVLLGMSYDSAIDMWSLGCIAVELFLGFPLFPGTGEYDQISRIIDMLGMPPKWMLDRSEISRNFFDPYLRFNSRHQMNETQYRLKTPQQYSVEYGTTHQPRQQYFRARTLPGIIESISLPPGVDPEKEYDDRGSFLRFCQGLLDLDPHARLTPQQAKLLPFIAGKSIFLGSEANNYSGVQPSLPKSPSTLLSSYVREPLSSSSFPSRPPSPPPPGGNLTTSRSLKRTRTSPRFIPYPKRHRSNNTVINAQIATTSGQLMSSDQEDLPQGPSMDLDPSVFSFELDISTDPSFFLPNGTESGWEEALQGILGCGNPTDPSGQVNHPPQLPNPIANDAMAIQSHQESSQSFQHSAFDATARFPPSGSFSQSIPRSSDGADRGYTLTELYRPFHSGGDYSLF